MRALSLKSIAGSGSPDRIKFRAFSTPIIRGKRCVPPAPGIKPNLISGSANNAFGCATR